MEGEYWFTLDGLILDAGKAEGPNHEKIVFETLRKRFLIDLRASSRFGSIAEMLRGLDDPTAIRCGLHDIGDMLGKSREITPKEADAFKRTVARDIGWSENLIDTFLDNNDVELRSYACKTWGWIRTAGHNIQFWKITRPQLRLLTDSLSKLGVRGEDRFVLEERESDRMFRDVPFVVLQRTNAAALRDYQTGTAAAKRALPVGG